VGGSPLNRQDAKDVMFQQTLRELVRAHAAEKANVGCVQCERCLRCTECTFCRESTGLVRCHYCVELESSVDCTHCRTSRQLLRCNHCSGSERCAGSAYLSFCLDCSDCAYCFGCVGLSGVEFHLLNQRLDRASFFRATAELSHQLGSLSLEALLGR
jgi:hypothetical protein